MTTCGTTSGELMIIWFKDGSSLGLPVEPLALYDLYQEAQRGLFTIFVHFSVKVGAKRNVLDIDADKTFSDVIREGFPTLPPDVPRDTEPGHDAGDEDEWAWTSRPPHSSTMPCRER